MHIVGRARGEAGAPGDSRCTPEAIWRPCLEAAAIAQWDLDPASNAHSRIPAIVAWTGASAAEDGLLLPWAGDVWCNPPFSAMAAWVGKALREAGRVESLTMLVPADSSTAWWRRLARGCAAWAVWPRREHFPAPGEGGRGSPGGGVHLFWLGARAPARALVWRAGMEAAGALVFGPAIAGDSYRTIQNAAAVRGRARGCPRTSRRASIAGRRGP